MNTKTDEKFAAWRAFLQAGSTVLKTLAREMEEDQHLPLTWFDVLAWLSRAPEGRLRMQVLANSMYLSNSGLTRLLNRMTSAGLVERQTCAEDRRGWYAVLTAKGREVLERATPGHKRGVQTHFLNHLNDKDIRDLNRITAKIIGTQNDQKTLESSISLKENLKSTLAPKGELNGKGS
jgi:DNA-binding MarR family transcriptional regulator